MVLLILLHLLTRPLGQDRLIAAIPPLLLKQLLTVVAVLATVKMSIVVIASATGISLLKLVVGLLNAGR